MSAERNVYLDEAVAQQERLEQDLRSKRSAPEPGSTVAAAPQPNKAWPRRTHAVSGRRAMASPMAGSMSAVIPAPG